MKLFFITAVFSIIFFQTSFAQKKGTPERPKLVVGIVIEGMRPDFIYRFWDNYGSSGFKRLVSKGKVYKNAEYAYLYPESAAAYATLITGSNPATHGVIGNNWYNQLTKKYENSVEDNEYRILGSDASGTGCSPSRLLCSALGDELRLSNYKQSKVFSIALKDYAAVLSAGHAGSGAFWYDIPSGNWVSSSYYFPALPTWVKRFNNRNLSEIYMARTWNTFYTLTQYNSLGDDNAYEKGYAEGRHIFPYEMPKMRYKNNNYELLHSTPFGNTMVREFAVSALVNEKLGKDSHPDLLTISFSANAGVADRFGLRSVEIEDIYIRLDQEIERLLDFIDDFVGLENTLVYLTADCGSEDMPSFLTDIRFPVQKFNRRGAEFLTKSYLKAVYEKNYLIDEFTKSGIYFDRELLEKSDIDISEIQNRTALFLADFAGIAHAYSAAGLETGSFSQGNYMSAQKQYIRKRSPDVLIEFKPGTIDSDGEFTASGNRNYLNVPLIFYGWKIAAGESVKKVSPADIAPTLSTILQISYPNASAGMPLSDLKE
jgi:predicted AlkP superfamily pyrophosphatase or phosphodiesterase